MLPGSVTEVRPVQLRKAPAQMRFTPSSMVRVVMEPIPWKTLGLMTEMEPSICTAVTG